MVAGYHHFRKPPYLPLSLGINSLPTSWACRTLQHWCHRCFHWPRPGWYTQHWNETAGNHQNMVNLIIRCSLIWTNLVVFYFSCLKILSYETLVVSCCDPFTRKRSKVQPKCRTKIWKIFEVPSLSRNKMPSCSVTWCFFLRVPLPNGLFMSYKWGGDPNHLRYLGWSSKLAATLENLPILELVLHHFMHVFDTLTYYITHTLHIQTNHISFAWLVLASENFMDGQTRQSM